MSASYTLDIRDRNGVASRANLAGQNIIIGRARDAQVYLDSNTISRRHAEMILDPFGRWWIRDLGSRNGTLINGIRITEHVVKPGDTIQAGEFTFSLVAVEEAPPPVPESSTATVPVIEGPAGKISTLMEYESPRLAATHLSILSEFGQTLLALDDPVKRLEALCALMVRPEFRGRTAIALRASKESFTEPAKPLCESRSAKGHENATPYISRTLLRTLLARNEPVLASNASGSVAGPQQSNLAELSISSDVMTISAVACPLKSEKTYSDLIYIIFPPECGTSEWLALASLAVKQFQQAESTHIARKLGEDHASIERELSRAHAIQSRLVPHKTAVPHLDFAIGFVPCRWVGGDYVDVIRGSGGKVLLTVADVCGKGLPAALVASSLHMLTHTAMRSDTSLPIIMQNLNVYLAETLSEGTFVTMLAALLDPATGHLETINAGHPAGLVISPSGDLTFTQQSANMPLGLDADAELIANRDNLEPGSYLVLFTDGLTELPTAEGALLGEEALAEHVQNLIRAHPANAADLSAKLSNLLDSLQQGMARDDRTFLLARRV